MSQSKAQLIDNLVFPLTGALGSASAPTFSFTSDSDTGVYSPGAGQLAFSTNGVGRLSIDASGNVLIGATGSATRLLTVNQTGVTGGEYGIRVSQQSATSNALELTIDTTNSISKLFQKSTIPLVLGTDDTERLRITSTGNVGIGTASPGTQLMAYGASGTAISLNNASTGTTNTSGFQLQTGAGGDAYVWNYSNSFIAFATNNTERLRIDSSGRVGIGTSSPNYKLDVAGAADSVSIGTSLAYGVAGPVYSAFRFNNSSFAGGASEIRNIADGSTTVGSRLAFFTSQTSTATLTERLRINELGNVGIGTNSPGSRLHVEGNIQTGATGHIIYTNNIACYSSSVDTTIDASSANLILKTSGSERLRITSSGNVGIGTISPARTLDVSGTSYFRDAVDFYNPSGGAVASTQLTFGSAALPSAARIFAQTETGTAGSLYLQSAQSGTGTMTTRMILTSEGRVGIGTTSPGVNLDVASTTPIVRVNATGGGTPSLSLFSAGVYDWSLQGGTALKFIQDATERARIDSSGRVGIGTTGPVATLHSRTDNAGSGSTPLLIQNRSVLANTAVGISFCPNQSDTADRSAIIYGVNSSGGSGNATDLTFHTNPNGGSPTERVRIDSSGRVGIGTTTPNAPLNIASDNVPARGQISLQTSTASNFSQITFYDRTTLGAQIYQAYGTSNELVIQNVLNGPLTFGTNNIERLRIDSSGNVGIGTTSPGSTLDVNGAIRSANYHMSDGSTGVATTVGFSTSNGPAVEFFGSATAGSGSLIIKTAGSERARITSSGRVGIGTPTPGTPLEISSSTTDTRIAITNANVGSGSSKGLELVQNGQDAYIVPYGTGFLSLCSNATERLRITSTGAFSLGATSANTGTTGQVLNSQGSSTFPTWRDPIVSGTAVATTSGVSATITGIPSWAKRVTVMCNGVTTNGTSIIYIRAGAGSVQTTGYFSFLAAVQNALNTTMLGITDGFMVPGTAAGDIRHVSYTLTKMDGNTWVISGTSLSSGSAFVNSFVSGLVAVTGTLDRISLTTQGGANTFTAGTFNITYE